MARASGSGHCIRITCGPYDFVSTRTHDGRALKLLTVLDEYTRRCLAIRVGRRTRDDVARFSPISAARSARASTLGRRAALHAKLVRRSDVVATTRLASRFGRGCTPRSGSIETITLVPQNASAPGTANVPESCYPEELLGIPRVSEPQACGADLEAGGAESAQTATETGPWAVRIRSRGSAMSSASVLRQSPVATLPA